jgi:hypothetical protein
MSGRENASQRGVMIGRGFRHAGRYGEYHTLGCKTAAGKNVVDQKVVDTAVAVLEGVHKNESIGEGGSMTDRGGIESLKSP